MRNHTVKEGRPLLAVKTLFANVLDFANIKFKGDNISLSDNFTCRSTMSKLLKAVNQELCEMLLGNINKLYQLMHDTYKITQTIPLMNSSITMHTELKDIQLDENGLTIWENSRITGSTSPFQKNTFNESLSNRQALLNHYWF